MSKVFEHIMDDLGRKSGYGYNYVVDRWNDYQAECERNGEALDVNYFIGVTMERDW